MPDRQILTVVAALALLTSRALALENFETIWDQQPDVSGTALIDQAFPDIPDFSSFLVNDFNLGSKTQLGVLSGYFTDSGIGWPHTGEAYLSLFPKAGNLPASGDLAGNMGLVDITITDLGNVNRVDADLSGLGITLPAGSYWIGLTPSLSEVQFDHEWHYGTVGGVLKNDTAGRNPGGGFGVGTDWFNAGDTFLGESFDSSFTLTGKKVIPESNGVFVLALGLVGLIRRRR
jgi:hypothetical protein